MSTPQKFRKKPVIIEAMQWDGTPEGATPIINWILETGERSAMRATPGDWIIRGVQGEFYPCKPDIFEATYEVVGPPATFAPGGMLPADPRTTRKAHLAKLARLGQAEGINRFEETR
ncbi:hypothetical protein GCM10025865_01000 [Paraoerskovia sediminicola]|uniref:Uncharacterized protein n=1 Tax=Paraoerskovia sediminicola TaxID=1138587 RepID=A0ABM8FYG8_9CELL|nr:hypothetical protein [Paraoerskovia sediminicola]BDZ40801.1 hypothetical protein GCM10025865_01000 [Paraoerskovia sediminicola]